MFAAPLCPVAAQRAKILSFQAELIGPMGLLPLPPSIDLQPLLLIAALLCSQPLACVCCRSSED